MGYLVELGLDVARVGVIFDDVAGDSNVDVLVLETQESKVCLDDRLVSCGVFRLERGKRLAASICVSPAEILI